MSIAFRLPTSCCFSSASITYAPTCASFHATRLEFWLFLITISGPPGELGSLGTECRGYPSLHPFFFSLLLPARVLGFAGTRMDVTTDRGPIFV